MASRDASPSLVNLPDGSSFKIGIVVTESDSKWFCGRYGFVLDNIQRVDFIPMAGKLGFFEFDTSRQYLPKKISPAKVVKVNLELWRDVILSEQPSMFA